MKAVLNAALLISGLAMTSSVASDIKSELQQLLKTHKNDFETFLKANPNEAKRYCPMIMSGNEFYQWAEAAGVGTIARTKIMRVCQALSMEQVEGKKAVQKPLEAQSEVEIPKAEGFVGNFELYTQYFDSAGRPNPEDIKQIREKYFDFNVIASHGLQATAQDFVRSGKLRQMLHENPALIGSIAQMQAYFGQGRWNAVDRTRAHDFDPSPILKMDYVNPYGAMQGRPFDVTIYSFFHTILEQADNDMPRDEETYKLLRQEIEKGIRVRHLMRK